MSSSATSSIRTTVHESLPYIDPEPTPAERTAAQSLIDAELSSSSPPSLPLPPYEPTFTPVLSASLSRIAAGLPPTRGIDLSRYESPPSPSPQSLSQSLSRAHTSSAYLAARASHLALLSAHGKNAWLVGNWGAEAELAALERELAAARRRVDLAGLGRRAAQDGARAELAELAAAWRRGVGRVLEAEVAAEGLRREVLERRRRLGGRGDGGEEGREGSGAGAGAGAGTGTGTGGETEMSG